MEDSSIKSKHHSLEEYRQAVKILKLNALQLVESNKQLEATIVQAEKQLFKQPFQDHLIENAIILSNSETFQIQLQDLLNHGQKSTNKDCQSAQQLKINQQKRNSQSKIVFPKYKNSLNPCGKAEALKVLVTNLKDSMGFTLEMALNCCDKKEENQVKLDDLKQFLATKLKGSVPLETINNAVQAVDTKIPNVITKQDCSKCLGLYGLGKKVEQRRGEREVIVRIFAIFEGSGKSQPNSVFELISQNYKNQIDSKLQLSGTSLPFEALFNYLSALHCSLLDSEKFAISRVLDPFASGLLEKKQFVIEWNRCHRVNHDINFEIEMRSFSKLLAKHNVKVIELFRSSDEFEQHKTSKNSLLKSILEAAPFINPQVLDHFVSLLENPINGEIDEGDFLVALSDREEQEFQKFFMTQQQILGAERQKILDKTFTFLSKSGINPKDLSQNNEEDISFLELKYILFDFGLQVAQVSQILKCSSPSETTGKIQLSSLIQSLEGAKMIQHGFEKEIKEMRKIRQSSNLLELSSQAELSQLIMQSSSQNLANIEQQNVSLGTLPFSTPALATFNFPSINILSDNTASVMTTSQPFKDFNIPQQNSNQFIKLPSSNKNRLSQNLLDDSAHDLKEMSAIQTRTSSLKVDNFEEKSLSLSRSRNNSFSSKKSVRFNIFEDAEIQDFILNQDPYDFNKIYEDMEDKKFKDTDFPELANMKNLDKIIWKNCSEIHEEMKIFFERPEPDDIKKGGLNNWYFLCALSSIAHHDNLIQQLFITKKKNSNGCFGVWFNDSGEWILNVIDESLPYLKDNNQPAFSSSTGVEFWVQIIEKCYAKVYGGYDRIENGLITEAIKDLTGAPGKSIQNDDDADLVWDFIVLNTEKQFIVTGLIGNESNQSLAILKAIEFKPTTMSYKSKKPVRLLKISDPWDGNRWQAMHNQQKELIRERCKDEDVDQLGVFWLEISQYIDNFSQTSVNYLYPTYFHSSYQLPQQQQSSYQLQKSQGIFQITLLRDTHCFLMLTQTDARHFNKDQNYSYSPCRMFIFEIDQFSLTPIRYVSQNFSMHKENFVEVDLSQGIYMIAYEVDWVQQINNHIVLSIYSQQKINLQSSGFLKSTEQNEYLMDLSKAITLRHESQSLVSHKNAYEETQDVIRYHEQLNGYLFFTYINNSSGYTLEEEITIQGENLEIIEQPEIYTCVSSNSFSITVQPNQKKVVLCKLTRSEANLTIKTAYEMSSKRSPAELIDQFLQDPRMGERKSFNNKLIEYFFKVCKHEDGFVMLFQNNTVSYIAHESISFNNTNLQIVQGSTSNFHGNNECAEFEVPPRSYYGIVLEIIDKTAPFDLKYNSKQTSFTKPLK